MGVAQDIINEVLHEEQTINYITKIMVLSVIKYMQKYHRNRTFSFGKNRLKFNKAQ